MSYERILVEKQNHTLIITLNRPQKLNPMSNQVFSELLDAMEGLEDDTRFVIITGTGRGFSAGGDQAELLGMAADGPALFRTRQRQRCKLAAQSLNSLENLEQVTIAALNGITLGAGLGLAMACDFRIATEEAVIGIPETYTGLFFAFGCTPRLVHLIGPARAKELIMTGDTISARQALTIGLVNKVVASAELLPACHELIGKIAARAPLATRMTKTLVNAISTPPVGDLSFCEMDMVDRLSLSQDRIEAIRAFSEQKRRPQFKGE